MLFVNTRKLLMTIIFTCITAFILLSFTSAAWAVVACPAPVPFRQPDGTIIITQLHGDEFLHWTEDAAGNLIVFDSAHNGYCYAVWTEGGPVSTGELAGLGLPGIMSNFRTKGHDIPATLLQKARQERERQMTWLPDNEPLLPGGGLVTEALPVRTPVAELKRQVLIVHVSWEDRSTVLDRDRVNPIPKMTGAQIYDLVFSPSTRSVNDYYKEVAGTAENIILPAAVNAPLDGYQGIIEVKMPGRPPVLPPDNAAQAALMAAAITKVSADGLINFALFDANKDGILQATELAIGIIFDGRESTIGSPDPLYETDPRFWGMSASGINDPSTTNGVKIPSYFCQGAFHRATGLPQWDNLTIGVICHELGHAGFGFADTYDYTNQSFGQGQWSLMGHGNWCFKYGERNGASPAYPDAYNLTRAWSPFVKPGEIVEGGSYTLASHLDIYAARPAAADKQYFLLQQRKYGSVNSYDQGAFYNINTSVNASHGGMLIYHIDESVPLYHINDKASHYTAGIEEAHGGVQHMQQKLNTGDLDDLWGASKTAFSPSSDPASGLYSPFTNDSIPPQHSTPSGIAVKEITWNSLNQTTYFTAENKDTRCYIEEFSIPGSIGPAVIDQNAKTVTLFMPVGTDRANLAPTIKFIGKSIAPASGSVQNFTDPLTYTVTAENGATKAYTVTVIIWAPSDGLNISDIYQTLGANLTNTLGRFFYYGKYNSGSDKPRPWQVMGQEDGDLVLLQRDAYANEMRQHSPFTFSGGFRWGISEIYKYLNNPDGSDPFANNFVAGELGSLHKTDVKTISFDTGSGTYPQVEAQSSQDTMFYLLSLNDSGANATWSASLENHQNKLLTAQSRPINGNNSNQYWLRSFTTEYYPNAFFMSGNVISYTNINNTFFVRPAFKLNPSNIVFLAEIGGSSPGSIAADANYEAGAGANKHYKLTVLGANNGAAVGALSGLPNGAVSTDNALYTLHGLTALPAGPGNYTLNYKIVQDIAGTRTIVGYGASTDLTKLDIDTSGLAAGVNYTVHVWLQKNNAAQSHEATMPQYFILSKTDSIATIRGTIIYHGLPSSAVVYLYNEMGLLIYTFTDWDGNFMLSIPLIAVEFGYKLVIFMPGYLTCTINYQKYTANNNEIIDFRQLAGDVNGDGIINAVDLAQLLSEFNREPAVFREADIDHNGVVNAADLTYLLAGFNKRNVVIQK